MERQMEKMVNMVIERREGRGEKENKHQRKKESKR